MEDIRKDRLPREEMIEILFKCFETHPHWSLKSTPNSHLHSSRNYYRRFVSTFSVGRTSLCINSKKNYHKFVNLILVIKFGPRILNTYKYYIEQWMKHNYPSHDPTYKVSSLNNVSYKGWLHFDIKTDE
jgi:hypothetical protein